MNCPNCGREMGHEDGLDFGYRRDTAISEKNQVSYVKKLVVVYECEVCERTYEWNTREKTLKLRDRPLTPEELLETGIQSGVTKVEDAQKVLADDYD